MKKLLRVESVHLLLFALCFGVFVACQSTKASLASPASSSSLQERYTSLAQAVRNLPGVQVSGETVVYRGPSSLNSASTEMQFLVDDVLIPSMTQAESLYPLNSIRALRVVNPTDAISRYGARASSGLIELVLLK